MHEIRALIGHPDTLEVVTAKWATSYPARSLGQGFAIFPLLELPDSLAGWVWPDIEDSAVAAQVSKVFKDLLDQVASAVTAGSVAVVITQYWAGEGTQAAAVVRDGRVVYGPVLGEGSINRALEDVGVVPGDEDAFDTLNLGSWRSVDDLLDGGDW